MCGDTVRSVEDCKEAAVELLGPNRAVTVLDHTNLPTGCFVDHARAYFNNQTQAESDSSFLKSLCRLKNFSALPEAQTATIETITACGQNWTLPVYRIAAEDLERVINVLHSTKILRFALLLQQGTARLTKNLVLTKSTAGMHIVIAGQAPRGWLGMSQPPTAKQLTTHVDLAKHKIFIMGGGSAEKTSVCLEHLHLSNGKVWHMKF